MSVEEVQNWSNDLLDSYPSKKIGVILNKMDLNSISSLNDNEIQISAKEGQNIEVLKTWLVDTFKGNFDMANETIVSNARHHEALLKTAESLTQAKSGLETGITADFVAMDIRQAMFYLGSITGDISTDDLLGNIFAKFCIGK